MGEDEEHVELMGQRIGSRVMGAIIKNNHVVLIARNTRYTGCPEITMDQIKSAYNPGRTSKR
jgi:hypothetical protein